MWYSNRKIYFSAKGCLAAVLLSVLLLQSGCSARQAQPLLSAADYKLNTIVSIQIYDSADESLLTGALALCDRYELLFSRTNQDSELYRLNKAASLAPLQDYPLSDELYELLKTGLSYSVLTEGALDMTIGPVSSLWDFQADEPSVPDPELIREKLSLVGYGGVTLRDHAVSLSQKGMEFDLGASAKGYIADRIRDYLVQNGVKHAVISLGGNVLCIGARTDGHPFRIGVRKPFGSPDDTSMLLAVADRSVVTAGIYERYFEQDDNLYHHIIDPHTGYPYDNGIASVTVIAEHSTDADLLSTACFALGTDTGLALIDSLPGAEAVWLMTDGRLLYSGGFETYLIKN